MKGYMDTSKRTVTGTEKITSLNKATPTGGISIFQAQVQAIKLI